tara:strand:- start:1841 stop:2593 length:753 start_codon:yes stop_codon:yes gene_type:complete
MRYKIRKDQLEMVVESFVKQNNLKEQASEAKKHVKKQGFNDKEDESLGTRTGKESTKKQSMKGRRDDSYGKWGKRTKQAPEAKKHVKKQMSEGMFDKLKNKFKSKIESWLDKLEQSDDPAVQKALATVKGMAKKVDSEDIPSNIEDINVMESIIRMGNMLNEADEKGKMSKIDRTVNRIKEISGWGTAGAAFVTAVGVLLKAAAGAGFYTLGLPVGLVVMIMLAVLVPSVVTGGTASNKRMRDKTGDIRY